MLQIQFLDHVIIGQPMNDRQGYFSFKETGIIRQKATARAAQDPRTRPSVKNAGFLAGVLQSKANR